MALNSKVLLSQISALTFFDGEQTTHRRTSPVDQLICRGPGCKVFRPDVIQCYNKGGLGTDINWKCEADLPVKLKLGRVEVGCEGWSHSQDPYVLKGSCALTYTLNLDHSRYDTSAKSSPAAVWFYSMVLIVIAFLFAYPYIRSLLVRFLPWLDPILADPSSGGGGGGPPGGGGAPPPPYMPDQSKSAPSTSRPWWSGFLSGVVSATLTNLLRSAGTRASDRPSTGYATAPSYGRSHPTYRGQGSSSDMDDSSNLGPIRTSTGFGGTNNR